MVKVQRNINVVSQILKNHTTVGLTLRRCVTHDSEEATQSNLGGSRGSTLGPVQLL